MIGAVQPIETELSGWAGYPRARSRLVEPEQLDAVEAIVERLSDGALIARGAGMAYGDAAINHDEYVLGTRRLRRIVSFDSTRGLVRCLAGTTLGEIYALTLPHGWMIPVIPGTAHASVGGSVACDAHGKNHPSAGSFGSHVEEIRLLTGDGVVLTGPHRNPALFWDTVGGMGLTGVILEVTLRLRAVESAWIRSRNLCTRDLDETFRVLEETADSPSSLVWLDGASRGRALGRGVVMLGEPLPAAELPAPLRDRPLAQPPRRAFRTPFAIPGPLLQRRLTATFNRVLYAAYRRRNGEATQVPLASALHPLDALVEWNRLLGRRGFLEYQVALPARGALGIVQEMLEDLVGQGAASFLTSMKRLGPANDAPLSFPIPGYAFSFDVRLGDPTLMDLLDCFDRRVCEAGGRVYLAKDSRLRPDCIDAMYPAREHWLTRVEVVDPKRKFESALSRRLGLRSPRRSRSE